MSRQEEDKLIRQKRKEMKAKRAACPKGPTCDYCERTGLCINQTSMREETIKIYPTTRSQEIATKTIPQEIPVTLKLRNLRC